MESFHSLRQVIEPLQMVSNGLGQIIVGLYEEKSTIPTISENRQNFFWWLQLMVDKDSY